MASLLPLLHDLLPIFIPSSVQITRASDVKPAVSQGEPSLDRAGSDGAQAAGAPAGVTSQDAIVNRNDKMCAAVLRARPKSSSCVYHNAEQDAIIYAVSGTGILATHPEDDEADATYHDLSPGDFALVPAWTEHQVVNSSDAEVVWVIIRGGPHPTVVRLTEWGGPEAKSSR